MPLSIDIPNIASIGVNQLGSGTTTNLNVTIGAGVNRLLLCAAADWVTGTGPSTFTFNGVAVTPVPSGEKSNTQEDVYWAYVDSPTLGTHALQSIYAAGTNTTVILAIPLIGADLARVPSAGTGTQGVPSAAIACSTPVATANDIAFGATQNRGATQTAGGAPQTNIVTLNNINAPGSFAASSIAGGNAGNFTWSITSGNWSAIGVTVFGLAAGGGAAMTGPVTTGITHPIDQSITGVPI